MRRQRLPRRQSFSRGLNTGVNIRRRALSNRSNFLSACRVGRIEEHAVRRLMPCAVDEVSKAPAMAIEPGQRLFGIFRRWAIFHREELFGYAHSFPDSLESRRKNWNHKGHEGAPRFLTRLELSSSCPFVSFVVSNPSPTRSDDDNPPNTCR